MTNEQLLANINNDPNARKMLVERNMGLVKNIAMRTVPRRLVDDAISEGSVGLLKAINTFDPSLNFKFVSYAHRCITVEILYFWRKQTNHANRVKDLSERTSRSDQFAPDDEFQSEVPLEKIIKQAKLDERSMKVVRMRFGIDGDEPATLDTISKIMGISRARVQQIEVQAMKMLRVAMDKLH